MNMYTCASAHIIIFELCCLNTNFKTSMFSHFLSYTTHTDYENTHKHKGYIIFIMYDILFLTHKP